MVEHHVHRVQLLGSLADLLHLAGTGVQARVRSASPAFQNRVTTHAGALDQAQDFPDAFLVVVVTEVEPTNANRMGISACGAAIYRRPTTTYAPLRQLSRCVRRWEA